MNQANISTFLSVFLVVFMLGFIAFVGYIATEQEHRHKIELEKAKQGIFEQPPHKDSFFKKYCKHIILALLLISLLIVICYIFNVPSDLPKYILSIIK